MYVLTVTIRCENPHLRGIARRQVERFVSSLSSTGLDVASQEVRSPKGSAKPAPKPKASTSRKAANRKGKALE